MKKFAPDKIYAIEKIGTNGIKCLNYCCEEEDIEYIRADLVLEKIKEIQGYKNFSELFTSQTKGKFIGF